MLGNPTYYYASIRKIVVAFARVFNDIRIDRTASNGTVTQTIKVPLTYGPKEHWYYRLLQDPEAGTRNQTNVMMVVPRMSYEVTGLNYDSERKLPNTGRTYAISKDGGTLKVQYNPAPWNIGFNLSLIAKNVEDGLMVLEQILPFFTPDFVVNVKDMPELELEKDIPIVLNSVTPEDNWDGNFETRRAVIWTMAFTAKAYLYPIVTDYPTNGVGANGIGIIRQVIAKFHLDDPNTASNAPDNSDYGGPEGMSNFGYNTKPGEIEWVEPNPLNAPIPASKEASDALNIESIITDGTGDRTGHPSKLQSNEVIDVNLGDTGTKT